MLPNRIGHFSSFSFAAIEQLRFRLSRSVERVCSPRRPAGTADLKHSGSLHLSTSRMAAPRNRPFETVKFVPGQCLDQPGRPRMGRQASPEVSQMNVSAKCCVPVRRHSRMSTKFNLDRSLGLAPDVNIELRFAENQNIEKWQLC